MMSGKGSAGKLWIAALALIFAIGLSSCANRRAAASPPVTFPTIAVSPPAASGPISVPQTQEDLPPEQPVPEAAIPVRTAEAMVGPQPIPAQPPAQPRTAPPAAAVEAPPPPAAAVPQLGRLLTEERKREYNRVINDNVAAVQANLQLLGRRPLSESQRPAVERVKAFLQQVEAARGSDLELARSLSDRARLLADDLVRNLPR